MTVGMRYGVALSPAGPAGDPRTMSDLAVLAEEAGWDAVFLEDYIGWQGKVGTPTDEPWGGAAARPPGPGRGCVAGPGGAAAADPMGRMLRLWGNSGVMGRFPDDRGRRTRQRRAARAGARWEAGVRHLPRR